MNNRIKQLRNSVIYLLIIFVLILSGCRPQETSPTSEQSKPLGEPSPTWQLSFSFPNGAPPLYSEAELLVTIDHVINNGTIRPLKVWVVLPNALQLVSGNLTWEGSVTVTKGDRIPTVRAVVRSIKTGSWEIRVHHYFPESPDASLPEGIPVYLSISEDKAEWRLTSPYGSPALPSNNGIGTLTIPPPSLNPLPPNYPIPPTTTVPMNLPSPEPSSPIQVQLSMPQAPMLNQPIELKYTVSSAFAVDNVTAIIKLPAGARLLYGNRTWHGGLKAGESKSFSIQLEFRDTGKWTIEALIRKAAPTGNIWGDSDTIYINVGADRSEFGWAPAPSELSVLNYGDGRLVAPAKKSTTFDPPGYFKNLPPPPTISVDGIIQPAEEHHSITVTGRFYFWTKGDYRVNPDVYREYPDTLVPARNFLVQLRDQFDQLRGYGYTDANGFYSIPGVDPNEYLKARFFAYINYSGDELRVIYNPNEASHTGLENVWVTGDTSLYEFSDDGGTHSLGDWVFSQGVDGDGAFWIKDDLDRAYRFPGPGQSAPGPGTIFWTETSNIGNYFDRNYEGQPLMIFLKGEAQKRPDAVVHEYGHKVMLNVYGYIPSGNGPPTLPNHWFGQTSSPGFAWVEDWATFFALAVNGNQYYTIEGGDPQNLEVPSFGYVDPFQFFTWAEGDAVEGRVAGVLWDLKDSSLDGYDNFNIDFTTIWPTFVENPKADTFAEFWDKLKLKSAIVNDPIPAARSIFQNTIEYAELGLHLTTTPFPSYGGTISKNPSDFYIVRNTQVSLTANPATGYHFTGWTGDANGSTNPVQVIMNFDKSVTANFAINTYTMTYNGNGATSGMPPSDPNSPYNYNSTVTVLGNTGTLAKTGYVFNNWNTAADGSGTSYAQGNTFSMPASNVTLYAQWATYPVVTIYINTASSITYPTVTIYINTN